MQKLTQITEARAETLIELAQNEGDIVGIAELARRRNVRRQTQAEQVDVLEEMGYIEADRRPNGSHIRLTHAGWKVAYSVGGTLKDPDTEGTDQYQLYVKRLHGVVCHLTLQNQEQLPDEWRARIQRRSDLRWMSVQEDGQEFYVAAVEGFTVQLHRNSITAHLREPVEDWTVNEAVRGLVDRLKRLRERLAQTVGAAVSLRNIEIGRAECGFEEHHLAMLVDALPGVDLEDVFVEDREEDRKEVVLDKSPGLPEIETKGDDRAQEIGHTVEDELRQYAHHPAAVKWRHEFEKLAVREGVNPADLLPTSDNEDPGSQMREDGRGPGDYYDDEMQTALDRVGMR
jgi:DNA-binding MarR family transcriptional regulator